MYDNHSKKNRVFIWKKTSWHRHWTLFQVAYKIWGFRKSEFEWVLRLKDEMGNSMIGLSSCIHTGARAQLYRIWNLYSIYLQTSAASLFWQSGRIGRAVCQTVVLRPSTPSASVSFTIFTFDFKPLRLPRVIIITFRRPFPSPLSVYRTFLHTTHRRRFRSHRDLSTPPRRARNN